MDICSVLWRSSAALPIMLLAGCGGGGGGGDMRSPPAPPAAVMTPPAPTATPTPTPTPPPQPAPAAVNGDTAEYRATVGAVSANALAAYNRGATGAGVAIGIIDSGIDLQSEEFNGRISTASADVAGNASVDDQSGHGTAVAFTAAGRRNGVATHGIAFEATVIALRADRPGTCADTTEEADGCRFGTDAIARGVDVATQGGARVINMSLGGAAPTPQLVAAIGRATAAGVIVVIAAGNDATDNPDPFAGVASDPAARGQVIIAGSVGAGDALSSFSGRAGTGAAFYLAAVGERVRAPDENNVPFLWSGTSFAAPQIAGAVALLAQAFPNLSGAQIVEILLRTARDAGAAGVDPVYGNGVLDLTRAFQPVGTSAVAGSRAAVSFGTNAVLSAPMGDARSTGLGAVILDGYDRAFAIELAGTIASGTPTRTLGGALESRTRNVAVAARGMTLAVTLAPRRDGTLTLEPTRLAAGQAETARAIAGSITQSLGSNASFALGFAQGSAALSAQLAGAASPAFLVARDPAHAAGFDSSVTGATAIRRQFGRFALTASAESGQVLARDAESIEALRDHWRRSPYDRVALALDRRVGPVAASLSGTRLAERDTILGARFGAALGATRATSWFVDAAARVDAGGGWSVGGSLRRGWTLADVRGGLTGTGVIATDAFAADIGKAGIFGGDSLGLRLAQPLRVASGGVDLRLPTYYDYASNSVTQWATQRVNLAPAGRELVLEAQYSREMLGGDLHANVFWRRDPGHFAALPDDRGVAMRYSLGF